MGLEDEVAKMVLCVKGWKEGGGLNIHHQSHRMFRMPYLSVDVSNI